ncbi:MAG: zf-HC2 domain-containing protein [Armatimonadota bacterium]|nr:zf-HC2 domain-containing protein [Armatimonadota bacterium]
MNKRRHVKDIIGAYIYGDLKPEEMRRVREHLDECAICRTDAESQAKVIACVPDSGRQLMEVDRQRIRWSVLGAVRRDSVASARRVAVWRLLRGFSAAGAMVCMFVVGLFVGARQFRPADEPVTNHVRDNRQPARTRPVAPNAAKPRPTPPVDKPTGFVVKKPSEDVTSRATNVKTARASRRAPRHRPARERLFTHGPNVRNLAASPERPDNARPTVYASAAGYEPDTGHGRAVLPTSKDDVRPIILPTEGN